MTSIQIQRVEHDPDWQEPYRISLAIKANGLVFVSGQVGIDEHDNIVGTDDFEAQARQTFKNLATVLAQAGGSLADVVKLTIMVTDISGAHRITPLLEEFFAEPYPAATLFQVVALCHS